MKKTRLTALCIVLLLCAVFSTAALAEEADLTAYSRVIDVPGVGHWRYYAQNDPLWAKSIYEPFNSTKWRTMQETGCGPTALAIALSRQVDPADLPSLLKLKNRYQDGYFLCPCSVNGYRCDRTHEKLDAQTSHDFETYLPVILAAYAAGNNLGRTKYRSMTDGTSIDLFRALARAYNLHYKVARDWEEACAAMEEGYSVITSVARGVFTPISHYLVIASADDTDIYILDPYMRTDYTEYDRKGILEVIEPGLVKAKQSDLPRLAFSGFYMIRKPIPFGKNVTDVPE